MHEGFRRFLVLLGVFVLAFAAVFVFQRVHSGEGILNLFKFSSQDDGPQFRGPEKVTLPERPPLDLDEVDLLARLDAEYIRLAEAVVPSVVSIDTEGVKREFIRDIFGRVFEQQYAVEGIGSGVIVSKEGHVVTNRHVTDGKRKIIVTLNDGESYPAILIGEDRVLDIAVIRIDAPGREFQALPFVKDSDEVRPNQLVFAIGNPFGLGETITQGIISARERSISDTQRDLFQTDAAINPGNSGGPLVNLRGEIIGINSAIYSPDTENRGFHGIGFAIPANDAYEAFEQLVQRGRPIRSYLGVRVHDLSVAVRRETGYEGRKGAYIEDVITKAPADLAGLEPSDIVVAFNEEPIVGKDHFLNLVWRTKVGSKAKIDIWRGGRELSLTATMIDAEKATNPERVEPKTRTPTDKRIFDNIGLRVRPLKKSEARVKGRSVAVADVLRGSQAHDKGLQPGDFILSLNGSTLPSPDHFYLELFASAGQGQKPTMIVQRGNGASVPLVFDSIERTDEDVP